jgi:hypothetical protein
LVLAIFFEEEGEGVAAFVAELVWFCGVGQFLVGGACFGAAVEVLEGFCGIELNDEEDVGIREMFGGGLKVGDGIGAVAGFDGGFCESERGWAGEGSLGFGGFEVFLVVEEGGVVQVGPAISFGEVEEGEGYVGGLGEFGDKRLQLGFCFFELVSCVKGFCDVEGEVFFAGGAWGCGSGGCRRWVERICLGGGS